MCVIKYCLKLAHEMADAANGPLRKILSEGVSYEVKRVKETPQDAFGNGSGIV